MALPLCVSAAPESLFDGKSLVGWDGDPAWWTVQDGEIRGGSLTKDIPANQFIATQRSFQNFDLTLKLRLTGTGFVNSGVQVRSMRVPGSSEMSGYQVDYGPGWHGKLYDESRRNAVIADSVDPKAVKAAVKEGDWNELRVRAEGRRIRTWINGVPALDYTEAATGIPTDGRIAVQIHGGGKSVIQVRDVTIEELPPSPDLPTWEKPRAAEKKPAPARKDTSHNDVRGERRSAEEQQRMFRLPEGFEIELFAKESDGFGKFILLIFDQKGRAWSSTALEYPVDANENPAAAEALYKSHARDKVLVFDQPFGPGPHAPRTYADGLAITEGVLPYRDGAVVQHGQDVVFLRDTNGDGRSDRREVLLTGFGVQDSHLFPHQFTRAPGGWFWLAQGAFNSGKVITSKGEAVDFPGTRMARFRPDGSRFEPTCVGPCNIWGLVLTGEGEVFIQEANDYGYPVMPFHEYAWYPGCADQLAKSYQPPFPVAAPKFRLGGSGLSGLALSDRGVWPAGYDDVMYVANPITSRVNAIRMRRDGPGYALEQLPDLVACDDPFFRPIAMTFGPDGCLYVVDWYNKIISHNEVARNHPDRDKQSGRIWRVKPRGYQPPVPVDYTKLSDAQLIARLGGRITADAHLAWQTLADREPTPSLLAALNAVLTESGASDARRIQALWALGWLGRTPIDEARRLWSDPNRNVRREAVNAVRNSTGAAGHIAALAALRADPDPEVRQAAIKTLGEALPAAEVLSALITFAQPSLDGPIAPDKNNKPIRVGVAYDREFERFLVRMYLERHPGAVATFLDSPAARALPSAQRLFAILALEPKAGAGLLAKLLPQLERTPTSEELLRVAQNLDNPDCAQSLKVLLGRQESRRGLAEQLVALRTKLDATRVASVVADAAKALLAGDASDQAVAVRLVGAFQLKSLGQPLDALVRTGQPAQRLVALEALRELRAGDPKLLAGLVLDADAAVAERALAALLVAEAPEAPSLAIGLLPQLDVLRRRQVYQELSGNKAGAKALAAAVVEKRAAADEIDGAVAEKLSLALGDGPELDALIAATGGVFRPVLALDGSNEAITRSKTDLRGPFTLEFWVRLAPGIDNSDGVLGAPGQMDANFADGRFRIYAFEPLGDVAISRRPITPEIWTHYAVTRDAAGEFRIYVDGELDVVGAKRATKDFLGCDVGWTVPAGGTKGALAEFRVWNTVRSAKEIRDNFTRTYAGQDRPASLVFHNAGGETSWGELGKGARIARTTDVPPTLTAEKFHELERKQARYMELGRRGGDPAKGKALVALCQACHMIGSQGGAIGPNLSGAGAMGLEAVVRNIVEPNAAMEPAYRVFRLELKSGEVRDVFHVSEDASAYVVRQPGGPESRVPKADVRFARFLRRSLMPEGLLDGLSDEQIADLLAYIQTLR
ncbi:MAG: PVC-type heme-binding CxxCH protein [Opitutales bacterium]